MPGELKTNRRDMTQVQVLARIMAADMIAAMAASQSRNAINRPVGLQVAVSLSIQDAHRALGLGLPATALAQYTLGR